MSKPEQAIVNYQGDQPTNRQDRRRADRLGTSQKPPVLKNFDQAAFLLRQAQANWDSIVNGADQKHFAAIVYQEEPFVFFYLDQMRTFSQALTKAQAARIEAEPAQLTPLRRHLTVQKKIDIFPQKIGGNKWLGREGTSFDDIESMSLPLSLADIRRINRVFERNRFTKFDNTARLTREAMLYFTSQPSAREELNIKIPIKLRPLHDRLTAYFDYYTNLLTGTPMSWEDELKLSANLMWAGGDLLTALACYIPGRLGITPASAYKLYLQRAMITEVGFPWNVFAAKREVWLTGLREQTQNAYRKDILPPPLRKYQHFDRATDHRAGQILAEYYKKSATRAEDVDSVERADNLFKRMGLYHKALRADILRSADKYIQILPGHLAIREVLLASQYKKTLMLILIFDEQTHVTLELNGNGRLYGVPASITEEDPHVEDAIARDIFPAILGLASKRHPEIETAERIVVTTDQRTKEKLPPALLQTPSEKRFKKRSRMHLTFLEPELPQPVQPDKPKFRVLHTRSQVAKALGDKNPARIDRVMRDIRRFEMGRKPADMLEETGRIKIRVGKDRVVLEQVGGRVWRLQRTGPRGNIYRHPRATFRG